MKYMRAVAGAMSFLSLFIATVVSSRPYYSGGEATTPRWRYQAAHRTHTKSKTSDESWKHKQ